MDPHGTIVTRTRCKVPIWTTSAHFVGPRMNSHLRHVGRQRRMCRMRELGLSGQPGTPLAHPFAGACAGMDDLRRGID
jgi:hypothetical protein